MVEAVKILRLDLKAFGPFTGQILEFTSQDPGIHIIYGANEAGKSSSLRALKALLYGFPERTSDNFVHPNDTPTRHWSGVIDQSCCVHLISTWYFISASPIRLQHNYLLLGLIEVGLRIVYYQSHGRYPLASIHAFHRIQEKMTQKKAEHRARRVLEAMGLPEERLSHLKDVWAAFERGLESSEGKIVYEHLQKRYEEYFQTFVTSTS